MVMGEVEIKEIGIQKVRVLSCYWVLPLIMYTYQTREACLITTVTVLIQEHKKCLQVFYNNKVYSKGFFSQWEIGAYFLIDL